MVLERLRKRDLFCFVGEVILSPQQREELLRRGKAAGGSGDIGEQARREMLDIHSKINQGREDKEEEEDGSSSLSSALELPEEDLFCVPVKIGYGKGAVNPVSDSTTFFKPRKHPVNISTSQSIISAAGEDYHVGILPQGGAS